MRRFTGIFTVALLGAVLVVLPVYATEDRPKVEELISLHNLRTAVSVGNYYLKQESLLGIRGYLTRVGHEEQLGEQWNPRNAFWRQAEEALLEQTMGRVEREFASLGWLRPLWVDLGSAEFSEQEIDLLIAHFRSGAGVKQIQVVDHTIATHVMMTLTFSGKLKTIVGVEAERSAMQSLLREENTRMRFSIKDAANADAQAFALSPLGKKYFTTAILNVTGIVSRRIDELALRLHSEMAAHGETVRPYIDGFKGARI